VPPSEVGVTRYILNHIGDGGHCFSYEMVSLEYPTSVTLTGVGVADASNLQPLAQPM
jgi:hypothetical protein